MPRSKTTAPRTPKSLRTSAPATPPERSPTVGYTPQVVVSSTSHTTSGIVSAESDSRPRVRMPPRLERESAEAYERFLAYAVPAEGETRTFVSVARQYGVSTSAIEEQAKRFEWRSRCTAFERSKVEAQALQAGQLAAEAGAAALALCRTLRDQVADIVALVNEGGLEASEVLQSGLDASKILERLVKTERLILGLSTQNQSVVISDKREEKVDYAKMTDAELHVCNLAGHIEDAYRNHGGRVQNGYYRQQVEAMNAGSTVRPALPQEARS